MSKALEQALKHAKEVVVILENEIAENEVAPDMNSKDIEEAVKEQSKVQLSTIPAGKTFMIGEHEFKVLEQNTEAGETSVISTGFMAEDVVFGDCRDYAKSNLRKVIEQDIQPVIEAEVGTDNIVEHTVDLISVDMQQEFENCRCKVRPITFDEARKYNDLLVNKDLSGWWWTLTPWSTKERGWEYSMSVVSPSGSFNYCSCYYLRGVRPFCILKSNIFVSKKED